MRRLATTLSALGFIWALAATGYVLTGAAYGISTSFTLTAGAGEAGQAGVPLMSADGVWIVALLSSVTLLAGMPLGLALSYPAGQRAATWSTGVLVLAFSLVTGATVGLYYLPCAIALLAGATATGAPRLRLGGPAPGVEA